MKLSRHIPGASKKPFWKKKWILETMTSVPPMILAVIAGWRAFKDSHLDIGWLAAVAIGWLAIATILRIAVANSQDKAEEPDVIHEGLYAAVSMLHAILSSYCKRRGLSNDLRATFHRVVPPVINPEKIEQVIPYVGWGNSGVGRTFSINTGITGHAIRTRHPTTMSSAANCEDEYRNELVGEWGYTPEQAWSLTSNRFSAVAIPVLDPYRQHAIGVLYLDSSDRDLFDNEEVSQILGIGSIALSDFATRRYT